MTNAGVAGGLRRAGSLRSAFGRPPVGPAVLPRGQPVPGGSRCPPTSSYVLVMETLGDAVSGLGEVLCEGVTTTMRWAPERVNWKPTRGRTRLAVGAGGRRKKGRVATALRKIGFLAGGRRKKVGGVYVCVLSLWFVGSVCRVLLLANGLFYLCAGAVVGRRGRPRRSGSVALFPPASRPRLAARKFVFYCVPWLP